jgi:hypothetical protein
MGAKCDNCGNDAPRLSACPCGDSSCTLRVGPRCFRSIQKNRNDQFQPLATPEPLEGE